jgi:murein DD-endopeptidase MepM/ murein hydrolase activator NlpD
VYCAVTPIVGGRIGRGYGRGYNRARTATNQLHGGQDFVATAGTPVLAPLPGRVVFVSSDTGPRITAEQAKQGRVGQVRGMGGYGNAIVLQHDFQLPAPGVLPSRQNPPPLPSSFWTSYNHLQAPPSLRPGDRVTIGQQLGLVGNTTNGSFAGMGAHLHLELLQWARAQGCPWDEEICALAAEGGHLEILQWARDQGCPGGHADWPQALPERRPAW